jgi:hypothetical protein
VSAVEERPVQNTTPVMDRAEVERIAYQAIGTQFRLPSLFSMLLLVVGFVLGHYVAARYTSELADRFEARITALQDQVRALESSPPPPTPLAPVSSSEPVQLPATLSFAEEAEASPFDSATSNFKLAGMSRTFDSVTTDFTMLSESFLGDVEAAASTGTRVVIDELRKAAEAERDACLAELQPYVDRKLSVPAVTVVEVIENIYADQDRRLAAAVNDAAAKATGLDPRDTSVKIFPPMSEEATDSEAAAEKPMDEPAPLSHRYFPKPSAPRSLFFSPVSNRVPAPATSAVDTESVLR